MFAIRFRSPPGQFMKPIIQVRLAVPGVVFMLGIVVKFVVAMLNLS
jgi:hypothetical protein